MASRALVLSGICCGCAEEQRIDAAIEKTAEFFESLGIKTRLSDYDVKQDTIEEIVRRFEKRKWLDLGDRGLTTPDTTRKALEYQL